MMIGCHVLAILSVVAFTTFATAITVQMTSIKEVNKSNFKKQFYAIFINIQTQKVEPCTKEMFDNKTIAMFACQAQMALQRNWFPDPIQVQLSSSLLSLVTIDWNIGPCLTIMWISCSEALL